MTPAFAGPPYQTDDPEPVAYRHFEIYVGTQEENSADGLEADVPFFEFNYGPLPNVQFSFSTPLSYVDAPDVPGKWESDGFELGLKYRFLHESSSRPQVSFYPSIEMPTQNGDTPKLFLPLWAQKTTGRSTIFGGGGWERNPGLDNRNFWTAGIADTHQFSRAINAGVEVYGNTAQIAGERGSLSAGIGMNDDFSKIHSLVISIGRSIAGQRDLHAYAAYEFRLGPAGSGEE
ncbi:MAG TPA: hypothetical protein VMA98_03040 [Candidatus Acidoferrales bacterium]|nr:hypothetical protein [Candidatus Acidoferrales bacterium]